MPPGPEENNSFGLAANQVRHRYAQLESRLEGNNNSTQHVSPTNNPPLMGQTNDSLNSLRNYSNSFNDLPPPVEPQQPPPELVRVSLQDALDNPDSNSTSPAAPVLLTYLKQKFGTFWVLVDGKTKQITLVGITVLFQALKIGQVMAGLGSNCAIKTFFKWGAADAIAIFTLYGLIAQKLHLFLTRSLLAVFFAFLLILNYCILFGGEHLIPFPAFTYSYYKALRNSNFVSSHFPHKPVVPSGPKEIGLGSDKEISREDIFASAGQILGQYEVKLLPDSVVQLNPGDQSFCLDYDHDHVNAAPVKLPFYINGTGPAELRYTFTPINEPAKEEKVTFKLTRFANEHKVKESLLSTGTFLLPVHKSGRYVLDGVFDENDYSFRITGGTRELIVAPCPQAKFVESIPSSICLNSKTINSNLTVEVKGLSPFALTYSRQVNASENFLTVYAGESWIKPDQDSGDLIPLQDSTKEALVDLDIRSSGSYTFKVVRVQDRVRNVVELSSPDAVRHVEVFNPPTVWSSCDLEREYQLSPKHPEAAIPLQFSGTPPFTVNMGFCPWGAESDDCFVSVKEESFKSTKATFKASGAGRYKIISFSDKNCAEPLPSLSSCSVVAIPPPTLKIKHKPIVGSCAFEIGLEASLFLTGKAPFLVKYREHVVFDDGRTLSTEHELVVSNPLHHIKFVPTASGSYMYDFYSVSSDDYGEIKVDYELRQVVHALPTAVFVSSTRQPIRACVGGISPETSLGMIKLSGHMPFNLKYSIFYQERVLDYIISDIKDSSTLLPLPEFATPGQYTIQLTEITDGGSCQHMLDTPPLVFDVRQSVPTAKFQCMDDTVFQLRNHEANLPLSLSGESPWTVDLLLPSGESRPFSLAKANDVLSVKREGTYELLAVHDGYCGGIIDKDNSKCNLLWFPEPTLALADDDTLTTKSGLHIKQGVCEGIPDQVTFNLTGRGPWKVDYELLDSKFPQELKVDLSNSSGALSLETLVPDTYTYSFHTLSDRLYTRHRPQNPVKLQQTIFKRPSAKLTTQFLQVCTGQGLEDLELQLTGKAPFDVTLEWRDSTRSQPIHLANVPHSPFRFSLPDRDPGMHSLRVVRVSDGNGCEGIPDSTPLKVEVVSPPTLRPLSPAARGSEACVGEYLEFSLGGISPWEVHFAFNSVPRRTGPMTEPTFRRLIDTPGTFQVTQVCHLPAALSTGCCSHSPALNEVVIHPLPGAKLASGTDHRVHIHDGEMTSIDVTLVGTPPFEFTYTRSHLTSHKLLETQIVRDIPSNHHKLTTSLEGIYKVTSVRDKHCQYPVDFSTKSLTDQ